MGKLGLCYVKTVIYMMYVNIQCDVDEQKANFEHFNELKTLISSIILRILDVYQVKKEWGGGASIREGTSIRISTVHVKFKKKT